MSTNLAFEQWGCGEKGRNHGAAAAPVIRRVQPGSIVMKKACREVIRGGSKLLAAEVNALNKSKEDVENRSSS